MTKTITLAALAAILLLAFAPNALAKGPEDLSAKAAIAEKEGRLEAALKLWMTVAKEWPEDPKYGAEAHLHVAICLANIGKHEEAIDWCREAIARFPGHEKLVARAKQLEKEIQAHAAQAESREADDRVVAEALARLERSLKEKGLQGEELEREFAAGKARLLAQIEKKRAQAAMERAGKLWRELGLTKEEIELRRREYEELRVRQAALESELVRLKEEAERLKAARPPTERDWERAAKGPGPREKDEAEWREARDRDLDAARRQFTELGKRLGIPPEAVERLLGEHAERRHGLPPEARGDEDPMRRVEAMEQHLGALTEQVHAMFKELDHRFAEVMERLEKLEDEVRRRR